MGLVVSYFTLVGVICNYQLFTSVMRMRVPTCKNMALFRRCYSILHRRSLLITQYDKIKSQFPDHILLFQLGDFYEIMGSDAGDNHMIITWILS